MKTMTTFTFTGFSNLRWKQIFPVGGIACLGMLAIMVAQIVIFIVWPPPESVEGFYALFQENWLLGLLSLDLLYILNNALLILIYLALYAALKRTAETGMLISLTLGMVGIAVYYSSNTAFEMLSLSSQFAGAATDAQRSILLGAGQAMLAIYKGTSFDVYYVLNAAALLIIVFVMLRSTFFSKATAYIGLAAGILMSVPSTAGKVGLFFSLASLLPWAVFLIMIARKFFQLGSGETKPG